MLATPSAPLYVRWKPDQAPYALELRLDLVPRLSSELTQAERLGIEIGGMLLGSLPSIASPMIRVDEVALISRRFEDGAIYVLDPGQHQRFAEIEAAAKAQGRVVVGFFRSHLRPGPLQPALADRTLLSQRFPQGSYALLLVESREPRNAAFFIATNGALPDEPFARKFLFEDSQFRFLPEVAGEELDRTPEYLLEDSPRRFGHWAAVLGVCLLVGIIVLLTGWGAIVRSFRPASNKIDLAVIATGGVLKISWDHNAPFVTRAGGAVLAIDDGPSRRDVKLGPDELKLGEVDYEHFSRKVTITMTLNSAGSNLPPQTFDWTAP